MLAGQAPTSVPLAKPPPGFLNRYRRFYAFWPNFSGFINPRFEEAVRSDFEPHHVVAFLPPQVHDHRARIAPL